MTEENQTESTTQENPEIQGGNQPDELQESETVEMKAAKLKESDADSADEAVVDDKAQAAIEQHKRAHRNRTIAVSIIIAIIVVAVLSAFVWPGWANKSASNSANTATGTEEVVSVKPVALPDNATNLQKTLADSIGVYARGEVTASNQWDASSPVEQYQVTYTMGNESQDITVTFGQWTSADYANEQYKALIDELDGKATGEGNINVDGAKTGAYEIHTDAKDKDKSVIVWQNDTAVYQAVGPKNAVNNFFAQFKY